MCATAGILRTTEVWTCENTFLVPYTCERCAMDVAEVGQSKEQCQQHGSPSTTAFPSALAGPWQAGASRFSPAAQGGSSIPLQCGVERSREDLCWVLCLWGEQWSHLCWVWIWRGLGETKLLWSPDPWQRTWTVVPKRTSQGEFAALHWGHVVMYAVFISCLISFHILVGLNVARFVY